MDHLDIVKKITELNDILKRHNVAPSSTVSISYSSHSETWVGRVDWYAIIIEGDDPEVILKVILNELIEASDKTFERENNLSESHARLCAKADEQRIELEQLYASES